MTKQNETPEATPEAPKHLTAYQVAKACNKALNERGLKEIPPQMVYTYVRKGYIKSEIVDTQSVVPIDEAQAWIAKYVAQKLEKAQEATKVDTGEAEEAMENEGGAVTA